MKRLVVVIPTRNEEKSIGTVLKQLPMDLAPDTKVVVVDKSQDSTPKRAREEGALVVNQSSGGLGAAFRLGIEAGLKLDADVLVHIDGDMQYEPKQMSSLIKPILNGKADLVLGQRLVQYKMPMIKRMGNRFFSLLVSRLSGVSISDAQTGYRAFNRKAMQVLLSTKGNHTYTQETILMASRRDLKIRQVPVLFKKRDHGRSFINLFRYPTTVLIILMQFYIRERKPSRSTRQFSFS